MTVPQPNDAAPAYRNRDVAARNMAAFIGDGTFFSLGSAFLESNTVLPTFVSTLTKSPLLIGAVSTVRSFGYLVPQIFVAAWIDRLAFKKPFMMKAGYVMRGAALAMALSALLAPKSAPFSLVLFFGSLVVLSFADGFGGLPWMDIVAKTVPADRRAGLFGRMQTFGGLAAFLGGFAIQALLAARVPYPVNYGLVMFLGFVFLTGSLICMHFIEDPGGEVPAETASMREYLRRLPSAWRGNRIFQRVVLTRVFMGGLYLALPFFAIHAQKDLGFAPSTVGLFVSAQMVGSVGGGPLWGYLGDRHGPKWIVRLVTLFTLMTGALALVSRVIYFAGAVTVAYASYLLLYFCLGAAFGGIWIGFTSYLMDIARESERATLIGLFNTVSAPLTFLTVAGGWLLDVASFSWLFAVEIAVVSVSVVLAWSLPDSRNVKP